MGHSEEDFHHKLGNFFETDSSGLVSSFGAFRSFLQPKFSNLKQKLTEIQKSTKNSTFLNLRSFVSHLPTEVSNTSLKAYWIISSVFVESLPSF